jgi:hypothetical protein
MQAAPAPASTPPSLNGYGVVCSPLAIEKMPLDVPPPRGSRFGSAGCIGKLVAEVKFLTWTDDNLLRQVVYDGLREDKRATEVRRSPPEWAEKVIIRMWEGYKKQFRAHGSERTLQLSSIRFAQWSNKSLFSNF